MSEPDRDVSRRDFGRSVIGAASIAALGSGQASRTDSTMELRDESLLGRFCRSLSVEQRRAIQLASDDPKRFLVQNHWAIVAPTIADLTADQQAMAMGLIRQVCTSEGFARLTVGRDDDSGGWKHDHLAVFGSPDQDGPFEWVLTGRHLTLRGSWTGSVARGPLFFGHSEPGSTSIWRDQADLAGALFRSLDANQRRQAITRLDLAQLDPDGQAAGRRLVASLMAPFRGFDLPSIRDCMGGGNLKSVRWQGFWEKTSPAANPPEIWRLTGPGFNWSFHGLPHVHAWFDLV